MTTRAHLETLFTAFNEHDVDKIMTYFTSDVTWEDPSLSQPAVGTKEAHDTVVAIFTAFPDLHFDPKSVKVLVAQDGKTAMSSWTWSGTMNGPIDPPGYAPTGKPASVTGACVYDLEDGLIRRHVVIYDLLGMLQQLGLMPGSESLSVKAMVGAQRLGHEIAGRAKGVLHR